MKNPSMKMAKQLVRAREADLLEVGRKMSESDYIDFGKNPKSDVEHYIRIKENSDSIDIDEVCLCVTELCEEKAQGF